MTLKSPDDVVVFAGSAVEESSAHGELVYVGYGASAPEYKWDDFKGMDVKGKILLALVNDPPATAAEPKLFAAASCSRTSPGWIEAQSAAVNGPCSVEAPQACV